MTDRLVIKRNKTREKIIQTAIGIFSQKGFHLTKMEEIAEKASVAKGTIYIYFRTKKELFSSLFSQALHLIEERILRVNQKETDPQVRLENIPTVLFEILQERKEFFQLIFQNFFLADPQSKTVFEQWKRRMVSALSSDIQETGKGKDSSAKIAAQIVFYFLLSLALGFLNGDLEIQEKETMRLIRWNYNALLGVLQNEV
ncbi:MAG: TetR/AcrR family transcriptional regulator [bacterium]